MVLFPHVSNIVEPYIRGLIRDVRTSPPQTGFQHGGRVRIVSVRSRPCHVALSSSPSTFTLSRFACCACHPRRRATTCSITTLSCRRSRCSKGGSVLGIKIAGCLLSRESFAGGMRFQRRLRWSSLLGKRLSPTRAQSIRVRWGCKSSGRRLLIDHFVSFLGGATRHLTRGLPC